jgi:hypothetical protein
MANEKSMVSRASALSEDLNNLCSGGHHIIATKKPQREITKKQKKQKAKTYTLLWELPRPRMSNIES